MKSLSPWFLLTVIVVALGGACPQAAGFSGHVDYVPPGCSYDPSNGVTASLSATGAVVFTVQGWCQPGESVYPLYGPISGKLSYDPLTNRFSEKLLFLAAQSASEIETTGLCAANPWTNPAPHPCSNQAVAIKGDFGAADAMLVSSASLAPFSLMAVPELTSGAQGSLQPRIEVQQLFVTALAQASRPNPPASPVLVQAQSTLQQAVSVRWLAPDESGNRPFTHFLVQARLAAASGAPWTTLGDVPRNQSGTYMVTMRLPPPITGFPPGWAIAACSATALTMTCSSPVSVDPARAEYTAGGTVSLGNFVPVTPKVEDVQSGTVSAGTFVPPPVPFDVRFAAWATKVTVAWKLADTNPTVIDDYSVEENSDSATQNWRRLGSVTRGSSRDYSAHVVRAASYASWLRVCAEHAGMRSCSQPIRVTSTPPQQSLQNDRSNVFRMAIPAAPGTGH